MIAEYIRIALLKAHYEYIEDGACFFATIPGLDGVWSEGKTLEECRDTLAEVIEDWVLAHINDHVPAPEVDGVVICARLERSLACTESILWERKRACQKVQLPVSQICPVIAYSPKESIGDRL